MFFNPDRYDQMKFRRCGRSGLLLPEVSLGLWHNFGEVDYYRNAKDMILKAFDLGITQFDLANNYGPPPGSAESTFGKVLQQELADHRDELIITSKAGYLMWDGPYGEWGSRKYLIASCDQSLKRLGVDYVDIFYSHRPDPDTPLEETMMALDQIVRSGKALYAGISNYLADEAREAIRILKELGTPCLIHQPSYSMFNRWVEGGLLDVLEEEGVGAAVFSPLQQGLLTNKYLNGIPENSRAHKAHGFLQKDEVTEERISKVRQLNEMAAERGQTMAQLALSWVLRDQRITSVIIGASRISQIEDGVAVVNQSPLTQDEIKRIDIILSE